MVSKDEYLLLFENACSIVKREMETDMKLEYCKLKELDIKKVKLKIRKSHERTEFYFDED